MKIKGKTYPDVYVSNVYVTCSFEADDLSRRIESIIRDSLRCYKRFDARGKTDG